MISTGADAVGVEVPLSEGPVQKIILYKALLKDNLIAIFKDPKIPYVYLGVIFIGNNGREGEGNGAKHNPWIDNHKFQGMFIHVYVQIKAFTCQNVIPWYYRLLIT